MSDVSLAGNLGIAYPERSHRREAWYETWVRELGTVFRLPGFLSKRRYEAIVELTECHSSVVARWSDEQLRERAGTLGLRMRTEGFEPGLVGEAFAVVREVSTRCLGLRHYGVQLIGGWILLHGRVAEMETGEGKTLAATLAAATAALAGLPVHVITVNDYLATRDAAEMAPLYKALGLSVGNVRQGIEQAERRAVYQQDIVYASNKEIAFDFLRDRIQIGSRRQRLGVQLERLGSDANASLNNLVLRGLFFAIVDEADSVLVDDARTPLIISGPSRASDNQLLYQQAIELAAALEQGVHFQVKERERRIELESAGLDSLGELAADLGGIWRGPRRREELVTQALGAIHIYRQNQHYLVRDDKIQIIDEYTGRVLPDRSWEQGLHQMIEAKESVTVTEQRSVLARTSYQHFFRRYLHLAGMTGTATEIVRELRSVYDLDVINVPTHRPSCRQAFGNRIFPTAGEKWQAVADQVAQLAGQGRPVLIGTRTVAASEAVSTALDQVGITHRVLSARQDGEEAEIITCSGEKGRVTVATNMAGRGTDIKLGPGVAEVGGLHVLATELHDSRRIDRQLFGRCGRQGDAGSYQLYLSLEDELITAFMGASLRRLLDALLGSGRFDRAAFRVLRVAQRRAERQNLAIRKRLLRSDHRLEDSLAFTGPRS